jgi:arginyl-tRNA synthetase
MQAAVSALGGGKVALDVKLCQLVRLLRAGEPVKMSKRAGDFVTLREVVDEVGSDAVRFMMLFRKNDAALDFDLAKVIEQSRENPVFYVQYAHARAKSVLRNIAAEFPAAGFAAESLRSAPFERLSDEGELRLVKRMAQWPRLVESASIAHEPHRVAFYLHDLASEFHSHWTRGNDLPHLRFIIRDDPSLTMARAGLVYGLAAVIASGLAILGVEAPEEMR